MLQRTCTHSSDVQRLLQEFHVASIPLEGCDDSAVLDHLFRTLLETDASSTKVDSVRVHFLTQCVCHLTLCHNAGNLPLLIRAGLQDIFLHSNLPSGAVCNSLYALTECAIFYVKHCLEERKCLVRPSTQHKNVTATGNAVSNFMEFQEISTCLLTGLPVIRDSIYALKASDASLGQLCLSSVSSCLIVIMKFFNSRRNHQQQVLKMSVSFYQFQTLFKCLTLTPFLRMKVLKVLKVILRLRFYGNDIDFSCLSGTYHQVFSDLFVQLASTDACSSASYVECLDEISHSLILRKLIVVYFSLLRAEGHPSPAHLREFWRVCERSCLHVDKIISHLSCKDSDLILVLSTQIDSAAFYLNFTEPSSSTDLGVLTDTFQWLLSMLKVIDFDRDIIFDYVTTTEFGASFCKFLALISNHYDLFQSCSHNPNELGIGATESESLFDRFMSLCVHLKIAVRRIKPLPECLDDLVKQLTIVIYKYDGISSSSDSSLDL